MQLETLRATLQQVEVRLAPFDETLQKVHAGIEALGTDADTEIKRERSLWAKRINRFEVQIAGLTKALRIVAEPVANLSRGFDELEVRLEKQMDHLRQQAISDHAQLRETMLVPIARLVTTAEKLSRKAAVQRKNMRSTRF